MNQVDFLSKMACYLKIKNNHTLAEKILNSDGYCFGFSVCYAAMAYNDQLEWWRSATHHIARWNTREATLSKKVYVAGEDQPLSLDHLFEIIINHVLFHFAGDEAADIFTDIEQKTLLSRDTHFFEVDGEANQTQHNKTMMGYFSSNNLKLLLKKNLHEDHIVMIGSLDHSCAVRYKNETWYFYDPNYSVSTAYEYHSKNDLVKRVIATLGHTLDINLSSLSKRGRIDIRNYYNLFQGDLASILKHNSFNFFVTNADEYLPLILKQAKDDPKIRRVILSSLSQPHNNNQSGIQNIIDFTPQYIAKIIELFCENGYEFDDFLKIFSEKLYFDSPIDNRAMRVLELLYDLNLSYPTRHSLSTLYKLGQEISHESNFKNLRQLVFKKLTQLEQSLLPSPLKSTHNFTPFEQLEDTILTNQDSMQI